MSHFTVLVIGDDFEKQLEPYQEQDFDPKYGVFHDQTEEYLNEYNNESTNVIVTSFGVFNRYDEIFKKYDPNSFGGHDYQYPKDSVEKTIPLKEFYPTFEDFLDKYHNVSEKDPQTGKYGYWYNPNAKWDWAVVGGRWTGFFKPKEGAWGQLGESGSFGNKPKDGWVDHIAIGDVDFDFMKAKAEKDAHVEFDIVESIVKGREIPSWDKIREKHGENIDLARTEYHNHPVIVDFNKSKFNYFGINLFEEYGHGREAYVTKCRNRTAVPYAVLKDGKWYQRGEMGWFGISSNEQSQEDWNAQFWSLLDSLPPETMLTLVDCHI